MPCKVFPSLYLSISAFFLSMLAGYSLPGSGGGAANSAALEAPVFNVATSGIAKSIAISCVTAGADIYYSMDGSTPTPNSEKYVSELKVAGMGVRKTIKAIAVASGVRSSVSSHIVSIPFESLSLAGTSSALAGSGEQGYLDGRGCSAQFYMPAYMTSDGDNLYVSDNRVGRIRKIIIATGEVTTLRLQVSVPAGIATDGSNIYLADGVTGLIWKFPITTGPIAFLSGFNYPRDVFSDGENLFISDSNNGRICRTPISTVSLTIEASGYSPVGLAFDGSSLFVVDFTHSRIMAIR